MHAHLVKLQFNNAVERNFSKLRYDIVENQNRTSIYINFRNYPSFRNQQWKRCLTCRRGLVRGGGGGLFAKFCQISKISAWESGRFWKMLQNAYFLAKIGADTAENEQHFAEILPTDALWRGPGRPPAARRRAGAGAMDQDGSIISAIIRVSLGRYAEWPGRPMTGWEIGSDHIYLPCCKVFQTSFGIFHKFRRTR